MILGVPSGRHDTILQILRKEAEIERLQNTPQTKIHRDELITRAPVFTAGSSWHNDRSEVYMASICEKMFFIPPVLRTRQVREVNVHENLCQDEGSGW